MSIENSYMVVLYNYGKYQYHYGPHSLNVAMELAHRYDGLKYRQAVVWNFNTGEDVYKSILVND